MAEEQIKIRNHWPVSILSCMASIINVLLPLVLARVLEPDSFGIYKIFFLYLLLAPGVSLAIGLINGLYYWAGQGREGRHAIQMTSWLICGHGFVLMFLIWLFAKPISLALELQTHYVYLLAIAAFGDIAGRFFEESAISVGRGWRGGLFYASFEVFRTISLVLSAWYFQEVTAVFIVQVIFVILKTIIGYLYAYKLRLCRLVFDSDLLKAIYRYALPVSIAGLLGVFINYADQYILSTFISNAEFALYAVGCLAIAPIFMFEYSVTRVMLPEISKAFSNNKSNAAASVHYSTIEQLAIILIPASIGLSVFADSVIGLLYPEEYQAAVGYLRIAAFSYLLLAIPNDLIPRARAQSGWIFYNSLFFALLSLGLCALFAWEWGAYGALVATLLSRTLMRGYGMWYAGKSSSWKLKDYCPILMIFRSVIICGGLALLAIFVKPYFSSFQIPFTDLKLSSSVVWGAICGPLFLIAYFGFLILWKLPIRRLDDKISVLMVSQDLWIGGLERLVLTLCKELQKESKIICSVFSYDGLHVKGLIPEFKNEGIDLDLRQKENGFSICTVLYLVKKVLRERIQILHSHDLNAMVYACLTKICCPRKVKVVHTQHSFVGFNESKKYRLYCKIFSFFIDEIIVVSEPTKDYYRDQIGVKSKIKVIENGIDLYPLPTSLIEKRSIRNDLLSSLKPEIKNMLELVKSSFWIVNVARISSEKGQKESILLWEALPEEIKQKTALIFVGPFNNDVYKEEINNLVKDCPSSERIIFIGGTFKPQQWYLASDLYISSSEYEGLPLSPLEAMGNGLPLVLSDIKGHNFINERAYSYKLNDIKNGSDVLSRAIIDVDNKYPDILPAVKENANWVTDNFGAHKMLDSYLSSYYKVLE